VSATKFVCCYGFVPWVLVGKVILVRLQMLVCSFRVWFSKSSAKLFQCFGGGSLVLCRSLVCKSGIIVFWSLSYKVILVIKNLVSSKHKLFHRMAWSSVVIVFHGWLAKRFFVLNRQIIK